MELEFKVVNLSRTDIGVINRISELRNIPIQRVMDIMKHSCWTAQQFADITGKTIHTVNNLTVRGKQVNNEMVSAVTVCSSFPSKDKHGPKFIVRDELSMEILRKSLK